MLRQSASATSHLCGRTRLVSNHLLLPGGPTEVGGLPDIYPGGNLPPAIVSLLADPLWCDQVAGYIEFQDPARVYSPAVRPG